MTQFEWFVVAAVCLWVLWRVFVFACQAVYAASEAKKYRAQQERLAKVLDIPVDMVRPRR